MVRRALADHARRPSTSDPTRRRHRLQCVLYRAREPLALDVTFTLCSCRSAHFSKLVLERLLAGHLAGGDRFCSAAAAEVRCCLAVRGDAVLLVLPLRLELLVATLEGAGLCHVASVSAALRIASMSSTTQIVDCCAALLFGLCTASSPNIS